MIASLLNRVHPIGRLLAVALVATGSSWSAVQAYQETEPPVEEQQADEAQTSDVQTTDAELREKAEADKKTEAERSLFFLGAKPKLRRQVGPALGKPRAILPQPYLPKGTIKVPPAPRPGVAAETAGSPDSEVPSDLAPDGTQPDAIQADDVESAGDRDTGTEDTPPGQTGLLAAALQDLGGDVQTGLEGPLVEGDLAGLDPSGLAILAPPMGYEPDFWGQMGRQTIEAKLTSLATPSVSPTMVRAAKKLALSGVALAAPLDGAEIDRFVATRLRLLKAHGDDEGYQSLLAQLPKDRDWSALAREIADGHLIAGRIEDACAVAAVERSDDNDPFWLRMATFCRAVASDRVGVDFQLGILEEVGPVQPTFYQLIDQILVESEQIPGAVIPTAVALNASLRVDVLEATMARLAKVQVPLLDTVEVNPLAVRLMLALPAVADEAKVALIGDGMHSGWLSSDVFAVYLANLDPAIVSAMTAQAALAAAEESVADEDILSATDAPGTAMPDDPSFITDVALAFEASQGADASARSAALSTLWGRAVRLNRLVQIAPALAALAGGPDASVLADSARLLRGELLAGNGTGSTNRFVAMRAGRAGDNPAADEALAASWPLLRVAGLASAPDVTLGRLVTWWQRQSDDDRFERAALLFTMMEALGDHIPDQAWAWVEAGPAVTSTAVAGGTVSPAHWRRLLLLAAEGRAADALVLAYRITKSGAVPIAFAGSLVGTLRDLGLEAEARGMALEILIGRGL